MTLQYNPRFTLKQARFHALSCSQLCDFLKNLNYASNKDDDKVLIEDAWQDLLDSLYDGSLIRWLKQLGEDDSKVKEIVGVLKPFVVHGEILKDLAKKLFDSIPQKIADYLDDKINNEQKRKSVGIIVPQKDLVLKLNDSVIMEFIWVETTVKKTKIKQPYDFYMGSDDADSFSWERPVHKVHLTNGYWLAKYPVTQKQWEIIDKNGTNISALFHGENNPMIKISWEDAGNFCKKLNHFFASQIEQSVFKKGEEEYHYSFALPTEAQWEFAARGGVRSKGYKYSGSNDINEVAWYYENSGEQYLDDDKGSIMAKTRGNKNTIHPVGLKMPNELGIHDMSGNVWEWCKDCCEWDSNRRMVVTEGTYKDDITDPCCTVGSSRVFRGGSWLNPSRICRPSYRGYSSGPADRSYNLGFRVALIPVQKDIRLP